MDRHTPPTHQTEATAGDLPAAMLALVRMLARAEARTFAAGTGVTHETDDDDGRSAGRACDGDDGRQLGALQNAPDGRP